MSKPYPLSLQKLNTGEPDQQDYPMFDDLDSDYYIDDENGTVPIGDLPIRARVVDPSWEWEFRTGSNYTLEAGDETKPVTWLVVAKNYYQGFELHVTLLSIELIMCYPLDNSTNRGSDCGSNHWGKSGTNNANRGLLL